MREPVFFVAAFESLYVNALSARLTPALLDTLRGFGLDLSKPLQAAYPYEVWERCLRATATALHPELPLPQAIEQLGISFIPGFRSTLIGAAVVQLGRLIGLERVLVRMDRNARNTSNVFVSRVERLGAAHLKMVTELEPEFVGRVTPSDGALTLFQTGIVRGIFHELGSEPLSLTTTLVEPHRHLTEIDIRWA